MTDTAESRAETTRLLRLTLREYGTGYGGEASDENERRSTGGQGGEEGGPRQEKQVNRCNMIRSQLCTRRGDPAVKQFYEGDKRRVS